MLISLKLNIGTYHATNIYGSFIIVEENNFIIFNISYYTQDLLRSTRR